MRKDVLTNGLREFLKIDFRFCKIFLKDFYKIQPVS